MDIKFKTFITESVTYVEGKAYLNNNTYMCVYFNILIKGFSHIDPQNKHKGKSKKGENTEMQRGHIILRNISIHDHKAGEWKLTAKR